MDTIGLLPIITSQEDALKEILEITKDKRTHVLMVDANEWLELKMKVIKKIAKIGLEFNKI